MPGVALAALATQAKAACPPSGAVSREQFDRYILLYNAVDPAFTQFYHDDVVMETVPPLTSAAAIRDFRNELNNYILEHITVEHYVGDETGSAAQFLGEFRCIRDLPITALSGLFGKGVKEGQVLRQRGIILYGVKDGKFKWIRAAPPVILQDWS
ncbi:hypothetical protein CR492_19070 [Methylocella silvestris]|uniref:SnoaL-like domain-containing protein n=1 Tax=Methylocella silvestris TaxID=199596 RepID=A0A2J7TCA4_METSI|nr:hypothetical protein CR492_19070 [Methylocella silvestris]